MSSEWFEHDGLIPPIEIFIRVIFIIRVKTVLILDQIIQSFEWFERNGLPPPLRSL